MLRPGTSFSVGQVIPALPLVDMRSLDPDGILRRLHAPINQHPARPDRLERRQIDLLHPDGAVSVVARRAGRCIVVDQVYLAVIVEEQ